jgi:hypothetical protein
MIPNINNAANAARMQNPITFLMVTYLSPPVLVSQYYPAGVRVGDGPCEIDERKIPLRLASAAVVHQNTPQITIRLSCSKYF